MALCLQRHAARFLQSGRRARGLSIRQPPSGLSITAFPGGRRSVPAPLQPWVSPYRYQCTMVHTRIQDSGNAGLEFSGSCFEPVDDRSRFAQIFDESRHLFVAAIVVLCAQNRRRMNRSHHVRSNIGIQPLAAALAHAEAPAQNSLGSGGAKQDQYFRPDNVYLGVEPRPALRDLDHIRLLVDAALAPRLPLEMLDDVGNVNVAAVDAGGRQGLVQHRARRADKRAPFQVLFVAWLLANNHHARALAALAKDSLRAKLPEIASFTTCGGLAQLG